MPTTSHNNITEMSPSQRFIRYLILALLSSSCCAFVCTHPDVKKRNALIPISKCHKDRKVTSMTKMRANFSEEPITDTETKSRTRSDFIHKSLLAMSAVFISPTTDISPGYHFSNVANAAVTPSTGELNKKQYNLSPDEIAAIVEADIVDRSFLTTGDLTRSIYSESAMFTDEIDTYTLEKWMKGTAKLFVGPPSSNLNIVGKVEASAKEISFRFDEDLMFRIPFRPVVHLTGKLVLERDIDTGLISSYREFWDQDVKTVLKSAKFSFSS